MMRLRLQWQGMATKKHKKNILNTANNLLFSFLEDIIF